MSRFNDGECDCNYGCENSCRLWNLHEASVKRALTSKRGLLVLQDVKRALLALPQRRLIAGALCLEGEVCLVGAYVAYRKMTKEKWTTISQAIYWLHDDDTYIDPEDGLQTDDTEWDTARAGELAGMARMMAYEMAYKNDQQWDRDSPEQRWQHAIDWVERLIAESPAREAVAA